MIAVSVKYEVSGSGGRRSSEIPGAGYPEGDAEPAPVPAWSMPADEHSGGWYGCGLFRAFDERVCAGGMPDHHD